MRKWKIKKEKKCKKGERKSIKMEIKKWHNKEKTKLNKEVNNE